MSSKVLAGDSLAFAAAWLGGSHGVAAWSSPAEMVAVAPRFASLDRVGVSLLRAAAAGLATELSRVRVAGWQVVDGMAAGSSVVGDAWQGACVVASALGVDVMASVDGCADHLNADDLDDFLEFLLERVVEMFGVEVDAEG